jgi:hypothetical protein
LKGERTMVYFLPVPMQQYEDYMIRTNLLNRNVEAVQKMKKLSETKRIENDLNYYHWRKNKKNGQGKGLYIDEYI